MAGHIKESKLSGSHASPNALGILLNHTPCHTDFRLLTSVCCLLTSGF